MANRRAWSTGALLILHVLSHDARAQTTVPATPSSLGAIPDDAPSCGTPGSPLDVTFDVSGIDAVRTVGVSLTVSHLLTGDLVVTLIAPSGAQHVVFARTGATSDDPAQLEQFLGAQTILGGTYSFSDAATGDWWATNLATASPTAVPSGAYRTSEAGGAGRTGAATSMDAAFLGAAATGTWTLRVRDRCVGDSGSVTAASLTLSPFVLSATPDAYFVAFGQSLTVAAPGVLANDTATAGAITAALVSGPAHGVVTLNASGGFQYAPVSGYAGFDAFSYRPVAHGVPGPSTTVSITVLQPPSPQPPTNLSVAWIHGNEVALRWTPPAAGPAATAYMLSGAADGSSAVATAVVSASQPIAVVTLEPGMYTVVARTVSGNATSAASASLRFGVGDAAWPAAPWNIQVAVNANRLTLTWQHGYGGGRPTQWHLQYALQRGPSMEQGEFAIDGESEFATFDGVPSGVYAIFLRAGNGAGWADSGVEMFSVPGNCTAAPEPPTNMLAFVLNGRMGAIWDPPGDGARNSHTHYYVHVSGSANITLPTARRVLTAPPAPGTYTISVTAANPCGESTATPVQTLVIP